MPPEKPAASSMLADMDTALWWWREEVERDFKAIIGVMLITCSYVNMLQVTKAFIRVAGSDLAHIYVSSYIAFFTFRFFSERNNFYFLEILGQKDSDFLLKFKRVLHTR